MEKERGRRGVRIPTTLVVGSAMSNWRDPGEKRKKGRERHAFAPEVFNFRRGKKKGGKKKSPR